MDMMLDILGIAVLATAVWWGLTMLFSTRMSFNLATLLGMPFGMVVMIWGMLNFVEKYS